MPALSSYAQRTLTFLLGHDVGNLVGRMSIADLLTAFGTIPVVNGGTGYIGGAWTSFTSVAVPGSGSITSQSSTSTYLQIGKIVFVSMTVTLIDAGTGAGGITLSLPVNGKNGGNFLAGRERGLTGKMLAGILTGGGNSVAQLTNYDNTSPTQATGAIYDVGGTYEAA